WNGILPCVWCCIMQEELSQACSGVSIWGTGTTPNAELPYHVPPRPTSSSLPLTPLPFARTCCATWSTPTALNAWCLAAITHCRLVSPTPPPPHTPHRSSPRSPVPCCLP